MTNLEYLKWINDKDIENRDAITYNEKLNHRKVKALEIIAEELCIANKKLTILVMGKLTIKKDEVKVSKVNYEIPKMVVKCPKGFTKKVMGKIKKGDN